MEHDLPVLRILTDRGTEYCGRADRHDYKLFMAINDIEPTKANSAKSECPCRPWRTANVSGGKNS